MVMWDLYHVMYESGIAHGAQQSVPGGWWRCGWCCDSQRTTTLFLLLDAVHSYHTHREGSLFNCFACSCFPAGAVLSYPVGLFEIVSVSSLLVLGRSSSSSSMDVPEPEQTPFTAVTAQTSKLARVSHVFSLRFVAMGKWENGEHAHLFAIFRADSRWCRSSNTKPTLTCPLPLQPIAGLEPPFSFSSSSWGLSLLRDGTSVCDCPCSTSIRPTPTLSQTFYKQTNETKLIVSLQSPTPSESTSLTSSSSSSNPNLTPPSPKTKAWKTATRPVSPPSKTTSSAPLFAASRSSSSGTRRLGLSSSRLCARGSRSLIFRCSGLCWWFTGLFFLFWRVSPPSPYFHWIFLF